MATTVMIERSQPARMLSRFAWGVLGYFILVVLWGAIVRATDSGGGCGAHWPLCNGDFFPHHPRLATVIEFTHRSTSGVCAFLTVALAVWTFRRTPPGHRARKAVIWSGLFLVLEALLGAALVLRHWVENNVSTGRTIAQSVHFTNTLLLMGALAMTASCLSEGELIPAPKSGLKVPAMLAVLATLLVGATGSLAALADTLFPSPTLLAALQADFSASAPVLVRMRWMHPAAALAGGACAIWLLRGIGVRSTAAKLLAGLLVCQFLLGGLDVLLLAPTWMQVLHLAAADLYWIALVALVVPIVWPTRQSDPRAG